MVLEDGIWELNCLVSHYLAIDLTLKALFLFHDLSMVVVKFEELSQALIRFKDLSQVQFVLVDLLQAVVILEDL